MVKNVSKNKYKVIVEIGYTLEGKRKRKSVTVNGTLKEAKLREAEIIQKYSNKTVNTVSKDYTFGELSSLFLEKYAKPNVCKVTYNNYVHLLSKINNYISGYSVKKLTSYELSNLYIKVKKNSEKKELSNYTMLHYYNIVNLVLEQAVVWHLVENNVNKLVKKPKREKKLADCYDLDELAILMNGLSNESLKYQALIMLAIDSGARRGEILGLTWTNLDFHNKTMKIEKSIAFSKGEYSEKCLKNNSSYRSVVLTENTISILRDYKNEQESIFKNFDSSKWLFLQQDGIKPMYCSTCGNILKKIAKKNNLRELNFHSLRHLCASIQVSEGIHAKEIQDRLGHSSINLTMSTYSHIFQSNRQEVSNKISNVFEKLLG